jgi:hypothetical protein
MCPSRARLAVVTLSFVVALLAGCGGGDDTPTVGGVGDACAVEADCRVGLICDEGRCTPRGDSLNGDPCTLTAECAAGLFCGPRRRCEPAGSGGTGDACATTADCAMGLVCATVRGESQCASAGSGDLGDACDDDRDCFAGLTCRDDGGRRVCASGPGTMDGGADRDGGMGSDGGADRDGGAEDAGPSDAGEPIDAGPGPYPIGGRVTGLAGGFVELALNGSETLRVDADGAFTFATLVPRLAPWEVALRTPPEGRVCTVSGARGVASGPVDFVAVDCNAGAPVATWEPVTPPSEAITRRFNDVWVADAERVYVVGPVNSVLAWDGTAFAMEPLPTTGRTFYSVSGTDREHIWVGGSSSLMLYFDGARWAELTVGSGQNWQGMWAPEGRVETEPPERWIKEWIPQTVVWAVSSGGRIARFDGTTWSVESSEVGDYFAIDGFDDANLYVARNVGRVLSGASGAFTRGWDMGGPTSEYRGITVFQTGFDERSTRDVDETAWDIVAVGATIDDRALIVRGRAAYVDVPFGRPRLEVTWAAESAPAGTPALEDVWGISRDAIWAVGLAGTVLRHDGTRWVRQDSGTTEDLRAVDGLDAANVWIVGDGGAILRGR